MDPPTLSVVVVTYERPAYLLRCLESLRSERGSVVDIVVVDASREPSAVEVRGLGLAICYVHAPELAGWMTRSRNEALLHVTGDVVAFLDDDVVVRSGWADDLRQTYETTGADAAVGRTCNGIPGEEVYALPIGRLLADGRLTEGFAAESEHVTEVEHGIGANMSFSREMLATLGGFRDDYPGTALREDTDIFLRIQRLAGVAVYVPGAVVDHKPAPHVRGQRFDTRYKLYGRRNHMVLLARHVGCGSPMLRRWVLGQFKEVPRAGGVRRRLERLTMVLAGVSFGLGAVLKEQRWGPMDPHQAGPNAEEVRRVLSRSRSR